MNKYKNLTNDIFQKILFEIINNKFCQPSEMIVEYPEIYNILAESLNNEILEVYEEDYLEENAFITKIWDDEIIFYFEDYPNFTGELSKASKKYIENAIDNKKMEGEFTVKDEKGTLHLGYWRIK